MGLPWLHQFLIVAHDSKSFDVGLRFHGGLMIQKIYLRLKINLVSQGDMGLTTRDSCKMPDDNLVCARDKKTHQMHHILS